MTPTIVIVAFVMLISGLSASALIRMPGPAAEMVWLDADNDTCVCVSQIVMSVLSPDRFSRVVSPAMVTVDATPCMSIVVDSRTILNDSCLPVLVVDFAESVTVLVSDVPVVVMLVWLSMVDVRFNTRVFEISVEVSVVLLVVDLPVTEVDWFSSIIECDMLIPVTVFTDDELPITLFRLVTSP